MAGKTEKSSPRVETEAHAPRSAADWEVLFEDPENGLLAMIELAPSMDALERGANFTMTKLLGHEDERARLADYERRLAAIVGSEAGAGDMERVRAEVTALLRRLKEEGKQAADGDDKTARTATPRKPAARRKSGNRRKKSQATPLAQGLQFAQLNKIGIIVTSVLALLAVVMLGIYLRSPEMPAPERKAAIALLLAHGHVVRPDESWIIEGSRLGDDDNFEIVFRPTTERHITLLDSLSTMQLANFAIRFCPWEGELVEKVAAYERQIRIKIKEGGKVLTSALCR